MEETKVSACTKIVHITQPTKNNKHVDDNEHSIQKAYVFQTFVQH